MKFKKPNFWDKKNAKILPYLFLPLSLFLWLINLTNKLVIKIDENENITSVQAIEKVKVKIDSLEQNISSDLAELFYIDKKINFEGNVIIEQNKSFLKGNSAVIDFKKGLSSIISNKGYSI